VQSKEYDAFIFTVKQSKKLPDLEDEGTMTLQNNKNHSPNDIALYPRKL
jgi:hypothetical protein